MAKQKFKITNWATYNKALIHRSSLAFWLDESAIQAWYDKPNTSSRGRPQRYSELVISTVLMLKRVFRLTLRAAQGFIDSIFILMKLPLRCPDYWPAEYADRNQAVARQRLTGSNAYWKWNTTYNRRSVAETAMYRVKQLFGGHLTLRDFDAQVGEAMAMIRALNKMTRAGMPESVRIA